MSSSSTASGATPGSSSNNEKHQATTTSLVERYLKSTTIQDQESLLYDALKAFNTVCSLGESVNHLESFICDTHPHQFVKYLRNLVYRSLPSDNNDGLLHSGQSLQGMGDNEYFNVVKSAIVGAFSHNPKTSKVNIEFIPHKSKDEVQLLLIKISPKSSTIHRSEEKEESRLSTNTAFVGISIEPFDASLTSMGYKLLKKQIKNYIREPYDHKYPQHFPLVTEKMEKVRLKMMSILGELQKEGMSDSLIVPIYINGPLVCIDEQFE